MAGLPDDEADIFTAENEAPQGQPGGEVSVPDSMADQLVSSAISSIQREAGGPAPTRYVPTQALARSEPQQRQPAPREADPATQGVIEALRSERQARQEAERQLQELRHPRQPEVPFSQRVFEDPDNAIDGRVKQHVQPLQEQLQTFRTDVAFQLAEAKHGTEKFSKAYQDWFAQVGDPSKPDPQTYWKVMNAPNPGEALIRWHREQTEIPDGDYDAYRARIEREVLERHGLAVPDDGQPAPRNGNGAPERAADGKFVPRQEVRLPTATSRMGHGAQRAAIGSEDGSDEAIFDFGRARKQ